MKSYYDFKPMQFKIFQLLQRSLDLNLGLERKNQTHWSSAIIILSKVSIGYELFKN